MIIISGHHNLAAGWPSAVLTIGTFDGMHLGHQAVVGEAIRQARAEALPCVGVTFDRHPASILRPESAPLPLATPAQNLAQMQKLGVSAAVVLHFDRDLSQVTAQEFFDTILKEKLKASKVVIGHDFAFGHGREGTTDWLKERIDTTVIEPFEMDGQRVSSTRIRTLVREGSVNDARRMLGRPYTLQGIVVHGQKLGRQLGYPTVNLALAAPAVMPADGIYAGTASFGEEPFKAAISIGVRPTVDGTARTIEAYLLDFEGDLYGRELDLRFNARLREEVKFDSLDELKAQMHRDVESVRAFDLL